MKRDIPKAIKDAYALATKNRRKGLPYDKSAFPAYNKARMAAVAAGLPKEVERIEEEIAEAKAELRSWKDKWIAANELNRQYYLKYGRL